MLAPSGGKGEKGIAVVPGGEGDDDVLVGRLGLENGELNWGRVFIFALGEGARERGGS